MMSCTATIPWSDVRYSDPNEHSDAALMQRLASGEMAALGELYQRYGNMVAHAAIAAAPPLSRQDW